MVIQEHVLDGDWEGAQERLIARIEDQGLSFGTIRRTVKDGQALVEANVGPYGSPPE